MPTPSNLFRPTDSDWQTSPFPEPFTTQSLEWRDHLPLRSLGGHVTRVRPGQRTGVLHAHCFEEEVFGVLEGVLTATELPAGAEAYQSFALRAGELVVYPPGTGLAHGLGNEGEREATYFGVSDDAPGEVATYPESGKTLVRAVRGVGVFGEEDADAVIAAANEAAARRPVRALDDDERPGHVVSGVPERDLGGVFGARLSAAGGARRVMVNRDRLPPGAVSSPLHWHSAEEEIVLVLSGSPTLRQLRGEMPQSPDGRPAGAPDFADGLEERVELRAGDVLAFGPHLPLAHQLVNESGGDCELLVFGLDEPQDVIVFPETGRMFVKALGASAALQRRAYLDGELPPPRG